MANIEDYLRWRGDLSFEADPFNEVDSLILTQLAYLDLQGIIPDFTENKSISMPKLIEKFWMVNTPAEIEKKLFIVRNPVRLFSLLKKSRRFSELVFSNYLYRNDIKKQEQFSAMTVWIPDGSIFIGFSGTDSSIVGWRENFNMTFMDEVPAQIEAVRYLEEVYNWSNFKIRLAGHSKGGNLAVFAAMHVREEISERIVSVNNFDGPGFRKKVILHPRYSKTMDKVKTYLPETSIVGRFLEHSEVYSVVKSNASGAWQHDAFTWQVEGASFVFTKQLDDESQLVETTINLWLEKLDSVAREQFVNSLFEIFEKANITRIEDFTDLKWKAVKGFLTAMTNLSDQQKRDIRRVLRLLWKEASDVLISYKISPNGESRETIQIPIFSRKR